MLFFDSPKAVLLLKAHSVDIVANGQTTTITFSTNEIANQEVIDQALLEKQILAELSKLKKQKAILVLANEIVFLKTVELTPEMKQEQLLQSFVDNVPLDNKYLESKSMVNGKQLTLMAVNKAYYWTIKTSFEKAGWSIKAIVPELVFGKMDPQEILKSYKKWSSVFF